MAKTETSYVDFLNEHFGGLLRHGPHDTDGQACALESVAAYKGLEWTDNPLIVGMPDLRPLNDANWQSDEERTRHLLPVVEAYMSWAQWSPERQQKTVERIALETIRQILPIALRAIGLDAEANQCEVAENLIVASAADAATRAADAAARAADAARAVDAAYAAARAVDAAADAAARAADAAYAVDAAADAATYAAAAYAVDAANNILILACQIWAEAAKETEAQQ